MFQAGRREWLAAGAAVLIWSGVFPVTRAAVATVDPILIGALRTVTAAVLVVPLLAVSRPRGPSTGIGWALLCAGAVGNYVAFPLLGSLGLTQTSAARASLVFASAPVFAALLGTALLHETISWRQGVGIGLALAGVATLIGPGAAFGNWRGDLFVFLATLGSSVSYVTGAALGRQLGARAVVGYSILIGATPLLPFVMVSSRHALAALPAPAWAAVLYLGVLGTLLANGLWIRALSLGSVVGVGSLMFLQPVLTIAIAAVFLGERLDWIAVLSGIIILIGVGAIQEPRLPGTLRAKRDDAIPGRPVSRLGRL